MERFVIVRSNRLNAFGTRLNSDNCRVVNMFCDKNSAKIMEKEIKLFFHINLQENLFNPELAGVEEENIIIFDGHVRTEFLKWIRKNNPKKRIILWLWNTVAEVENNLHLEGIPDGMEIWSYSEYDCKKYNLSYNTTFFWDKKDKIEDEIVQDLYFIGKDKGRLQKVKYIASVCNERKINFTYHIVKTHKYSLPKKEYKSSISYLEVQKNIAKSKAILDIQVSKTAGPSLRALEAVFYGKKLVTDDKNVKTFKFYNKNNIFIIGEDDLNELKAFLDSPVVPIREEDVEYYNVRNWLARFYLTKEDGDA
jgi:hypothetical protein